MSVTLHIVALWQYWVCCTRSGVTRCILFVVLFLCRMCWCGLHAALCSHFGSLMRLLAAEPRSIAGVLFPCQYLFGTIVVTPSSMVWDWLVSRAGPMPFYWPSCSLTFFLLLFSLSLLSFCGLVLWDWGLRTEKVLIALYQPCSANPFLIIIIIINCYREYLRTLIYAVQYMLAIVIIMSN